MAKQPRVLIVDFDFFTTVGGGQTFYRRVVERNPGYQFHYPSRGPDLEIAATLPVNARPYRFDPDLNVAKLFKGMWPKSPWTHQHFAEQLLRALLPVQGMQFDVVDLPSFLPAAHLVRPLAAGLGIGAGRVALAMLGWNSVSVRNAYEEEAVPRLIDALEDVEAASIEAADIRYVISDVEIAQTRAAVPDVIRVDMHDTLEDVALPPAVPPGSGPPDLWYVGRLDGAKGPDIFIELAARMPRELFGRCRMTGPDNTWAAGERWSDRLKKMADAAGLPVEYVGTLSDAELRERVYRGRSVLVVPSRTDAFNYVALEAVLSGCPVLLSRRAGAHEFLSVRHPRHLPASMDPAEIDDAAISLERILANYQDEAAARRRALRETPFPKPRTGFMSDIWNAGRAPVAGQASQATELAAAFRGHLPLMAPAARDRRPPRAAATAPRVSVVVPTFNRPALLAPTLASLAQQDLDELEVVVVDDGSKDAVAVRDVVESFAPMARLVRTENRGEAAAVNRGIVEARGALVGILSDDDAYAPELLSMAAARLDAAPDAVAVYPDWQIVDDAGQVVEVHRLPKWDRVRMLGEHWCLPGPGTVVRREVLEAIGGRDLSYRFASDFEMWLRASAHGRFVHLPEVLADWRLHGDNLTSSKRRREMAAERITLIKRFFDSPEEMRRLGAIRPTALAAAHLAGAAILGRAEAELARVYLENAAALDPDLPARLPPNMAGYPQVWPVDAAAALAAGRAADAPARRRLLESIEAEIAPAVPSGWSQGVLSGFHRGWLRRLLESPALRGR